MQNPQIYTDAKHAEGLAWTLKEDDNMPICQEMWGPPRQGHAYWSGYFTTRPALKRNVVEGSGYLQAARQLQVFAGQPLRMHLQEPASRGHAYGASVSTVAWLGLPVTLLRPHYAFASIDNTES